MIAARDVRAALPASAPNLEVQWHDCGGHVSFPPRFRLIERVCAWFARAGDRSGAGAAAPVP
jgi:hypothetical protein